MNTTSSNLNLATAITRAASTQTDYTIRLLVDRGRVADAYRAYAYFRWVDDSLDAETGPGFERDAFLARQESLLEKCYRGESSPGLPPLHPVEEMLVQLVRSDIRKDSGLQFYLRNMMAVMDFDVKRRGRLISATELNLYVRWLAGAVTEAMHYFIGHEAYSPRDKSRYLAVTGAHITHMLRDTYDDLQAGYFNIPREVLDANHITPQDIHSDAYRAWVRNRVELARRYFKAGREYLQRVENPRCRLAGFAYTARFECVLDAIEREGFLLRAAYPERKSLGVVAQAGGLVLAGLFTPRPRQTAPEILSIRQHSPRS